MERGDVRYRNNLIGQFRVHRFGNDVGSNTLDFVQSRLADFPVLNVLGEDRTFRVHGDRPNGRVHLLEIAGRA
jgi:hypothetical protein